LLFGRASYRSAGIHHYIEQLLQHLPAAAPDMRFTVFVGAGRPSMAGAEVQRTRLPTARPPVRIIWEQWCSRSPWPVPGPTAARAGLSHPS
jgi:hypothetical protein